MFKKFLKKKNSREELKTEGCVTMKKVYFDEHPQELNQRGIVKTQEVKCMGNLVDTGHTYWKFTQSVSGRSEEPWFATYNEDGITEADKASTYCLSFVEDEYVGRCFMYGDTLTKLCVDSSLEEFRQIEKEPVSFVDGSQLGEMRCSKVMVEKNYSLKNKESIKLIFENSNYGSIIRLLSYRSSAGTFESRLRNWGYIDSADLVRELNALLSEQCAHGDRNKEDFIALIDNYKEF